MNWHQRIAEARERGHFTGDDLAAARSWVTCACGEQDQRIPRHYYGWPLDAELDNVGCRFSNAVDDGDFDEAASLLDAIDRRAAEVLAEVAK